MSTGRNRYVEPNSSFQRSEKLSALIEDFNMFKESFAKPRKDRRRRRKPKVPVMPTIVKQDSNISEDSNDPKRR